MSKTLLLGAVRGLGQGLMQRHANQREERMSAIDQARRERLAQIQHQYRMDEARYTEGRRDARDERRYGPGGFEEGLIKQRTQGDLEVVRARTKGEEDIIRLRSQLGAQEDVLGANLLRGLPGEMPDGTEVPGTGIPDWQARYPPYRAGSNAPKAEDMWDVDYKRPVTIGKTVRGTDVQGSAIDVTIPAALGLPETRGGLVEVGGFFTNHAGGMVIGQGAPMELLDGQTGQPVAGQDGQPVSVPANQMDQYAEAYLDQIYRRLLNIPDMSEDEAKIRFAHQAMQLMFGPPAGLARYRDNNGRYPAFLAIPRGGQAARRINEGRNLAFGGRP